MKLRQRKIPGDEARLEELIAQHQRQLFGFIFSMVHSIADAEDVFQQTCLVIWKKFDEFEPESDFYAWASVIAKYKAIDFLRARSRDRLQFSPELQDQLAAQNQTRGDLQDARSEALELCKQKLSQRDRQLLHACYEGGVSMKEVAVQLQRPAGSVYDSLSRIRRALLKCIESTLAAERERGN